MSPDSKNFFWLIKLRAHFKDEICNTTINQPSEQLPFRIKNKEKLTTPKKNHTVITYTDLVENDTIALMKQKIEKLSSNLTYKEYTALEEPVKNERPHNNQYW